MIKFQRFNPPPSFPPRDLTAKDREAYSLGIKLTCAFELLSTSTSPWRERLVHVRTEESGRKAEEAEIRSWDENCGEADGEEWMMLSSEDIQRIVAEEKGEEDKIREMISNLEKLMEGESGFEGIDDDDEDDDECFLDFGCVDSRMMGSDSDDDEMSSV